MKQFKRLPNYVKGRLLTDLRSSAEDKPTIMFVWFEPSQTRNKMGQRYLNSRELYKDLVSSLHEAQAWVKGEAGARVSIWYSKNSTQGLDVSAGIKK